MEYRIGRLNPFITGWMAYFRLADTGNLVREMDRWLRRRLRQIPGRNGRPPPPGGTPCE
jgi:RNA-directed DNA polymerase